MFITRNWLQRFIDIGNKGDPEIAEQLSKLGFETKKVYTVENVGCCMAKVKRVIPLSDNDRLFKYLLQNIKPKCKDVSVFVIWTKTNLQPGDWVIYAPPVPGILSHQDQTNRNFDGYKSNGLLCSLRDLGFINTQTDQIWYLSGSYRISLPPSDQNFAEWAGINDTIFDIELTTNRTDCLGILFLVRELAAVWNLKIKLPSFQPITRKNYSSSQSQKYQKFCLELDLTKAVKKLTVNAVRMWQIMLLRWPAKQELKWSINDLMLLYHVGAPVKKHALSILQWKLILETGYPMIGIDPDRINHQLCLSNKIPQKKPWPDWTFTDKTHVVWSASTNSNDFQAPQKNSWLLVLVLFRPSEMRLLQKTSGQQGLLFERWIRYQSLRVAGILPVYFQELTDNIKIEWQSWKLLANPSPTKALTVNKNWLTSFLPFTISDQVFDRLLVLGWKIKTLKGSWKIIPPVNRIDVVDRDCIAGEMIRLAGYDSDINLKPISFNLADNEYGKKEHPKINNYDQRLIQVQQKIINFLLTNDFTPIYRYCLVSLEMAHSFNWRTDCRNKQIWQLQNALSKNHFFWQTSLIPQLLSTVKYNQDRGVDRLKLFLTGNIFPGKKFEDRQIPKPDRYLTMISSVAAVKIKSATDRDYLLQTLDTLNKLWNRIAVSLNLKDCVWKQWSPDDQESKFVDNISWSFADRDGFEIHPQQTFIVSYKQVPVALVGCVSRLSAKQSELMIRNSYFIELNLTKIAALLEAPGILTESLFYVKKIPISRDLTYDFDGSSDTYFSKVKVIIKNFFKAKYPSLALIWITPVDLFPCKDQNQKTRITIRIQFYARTDFLISKVQINKIMIDLKQELQAKFIRVQD